MHERLAAEDAEEAVAHLLGLADQRFMAGRSIDLLLGGHIDPAALAAQVAAVDDREVQKRREELAALEPAFVALHREHALDAEVPGELPEQALVGGAQYSRTHLEHRTHQLRAARALAAASSARR